MESAFNKTLLSKPNLARLASLYRQVMKANKEVVPFTMVGLCNEAAAKDFRNARINFDNTQFLAFTQR
jgi:hypothetical protein